ncbi:Cytochrome b-245 heavy chain [Ceratocystis platani]|uniref:Cytochrome b-245 heavy chain n=1 Tax=Ceratocystis fimbriata f. sp. platani TaxID=88771 RepID=A0A0F8AZT8_CERFI|nr:Cytochrome b-245 heavy chain [Ceratocystis platani]
MGADMSTKTLIKKQFTASKMTFNILFWGIHWGLFGYGCFYIVEKRQLRPERAVDIHYTQPGGITGHTMLFCMLLMYTTAHAKIRQQSFETFWYTHHLFIPFMLGLYTHATGCFVRDTPTPFSPFAGANFWNHCIGYQGWRWELWSGGIYLIERLYREIRARRETTITRVIRHPYDVVEIQFNKPSFRYKAGQWLFLQVPAVSNYQWHPFTITSCPFDPYVSVHVRQIGDFTKALGNALGAGEAQSKLYEDPEADPMAMYEIALRNGDEMPQLRIDGPYGAPAEDVFENEIAVLVDLDPLTELKTRTNFGRPNFERLFTSIRDSIMSRSYMSGFDGSTNTTVGVYFCGPSAAARDIKAAAKKATINEVRFRFWKEHF